MSLWLVRGWNQFLVSRPLKKKMQLQSQKAIACELGIPRTSPNICAKWWETSRGAKCWELWWRCRVNFWMSGRKVIHRWDKTRPLCLFASLLPLYWGSQSAHPAWLSLACKSHHALVSVCMCVCGRAAITRPVEEKSHESLKLPFGNLPLFYF